jgi:hypothetical protein
MCLNLVLQSSRISQKPKKTDDLLAHLHRKEKISNKEEEWLDNQQAGHTSNTQKRCAPTELAYAQKRPHWAWDFLWEMHEIGESLSAQATETAPPVPGPPENKLHNEIGLHTICEHSHLFKIVTPVDVDLFESLLKHHPNHPLIDFVCWGFRQGFWPWAQTNKPGYPTTWDNADHIISNPIHQQFLHKQWDAEIALEL